MTLQAITPTRILDTRTSLGGHLAPFNAGEAPFPLQVLGRGAVPTFGVDAVMLNVTVVAPQTPTGGGFLTLWPAGRPQPTASNINFAPGWTIANQVLVPVGADGAVAIACGFASGVRVVVDVNGWIPSELGTPAGPAAAFTPAAPVAGDTAQAYQVLDNAVRYLRDPWWSSIAPSLLTAPVGPLDPGPSDAVRRMAMAALALSTSALLGRTADPAKATQLIDRVASTHFVTTPGGWGEYWQTGMWAGIAGRAAWFMWDDLPTAVQRRVAKMIQFEAGWSLRMKVRYLRNKTGDVVLTPGDTGAEEVSWQSLPLPVAAVMLPDHPMRPHWLNAMTHLALAAWARPVDATSSTVVNGRTLSQWLAGSNVEPDGSVVNHGTDAPDYAATFYQTLDAVPLLLQAGLEVPDATVALLGPVYAALAGHYDPATGDVTYPQGSDWGTSQRLPFALADALALTYGFDNGQAATFLDLHLDAVLAQQARHADGHTYASGEYPYVGAEEHAGQLAAQLALALHIRDHQTVAFTDAPTWLT